MTEINDISTEPDVLSIVAQAASKAAGLREVFYKPFNFDEIYPLEAILGDNDASVVIAGPLQWILKRANSTGDDTEKQRAKAALIDRIKSLTAQYRADAFQPQTTLQGKIAILIFGLSICKNMGIPVDHTGTPNLLPVEFFSGLLDAEMDRRRNILKGLDPAIGDALEPLIEQIKSSYVYGLNAQEYLRAITGALKIIDALPSEEKGLEAPEKCALRTNFIGALEGLSKEITNHFAAIGTQAHYAKTH